MTLKNIILITILVISFQSYAQKQEKEYYENGQLKSIMTLDEDGDPIGEAKEYYDNGQLKTVINIEKEGYGSYKMYYLNGNTEEEGGYEDSEKTGKSIKYNEDGSLVESGIYANDEKTGIWKENTYYDNGNIMEKKLILYDKDYPTSYYKEEIRHGIYKYYFEGGQLKEWIEYEYGEIIGEFIQYYENGNKKVFGNATKNGYDGLIIEQYKTGELKSKEHYIDGKKYGDWEYYRIDGSKEKIIKYHNNEKLEEIEIEQSVDDDGSREPETEYKIHFKNKCDETIHILIRTLKPNDKWLSEGWWTIKPGESAYVADSKNAIIYYYAESYTGNHIWPGSNHKNFEGKEYAFKKWDLSNKEKGVVTKGLTCGSN